jgi:dienelactone hydrolase
MRHTSDGEWAVFELPANMTNGECRNRKGQSCLASESALAKNSMPRALQAALVFFLPWALTGCQHQLQPAIASALPGAPVLTIIGNPESGAGATWTLAGTLEGTRVDLEGIILKPPGRGPFPAIVLSHGAGSSAQSYGRTLGAVMRKWGLVCIATNYTHAVGIRAGAPGTLIEQGASGANVFRAHAAVTVLGRLGYVDVRRVAAHGHSMGAFVTTAFVAVYPGDVRVASHTAGGVLDGIHLEGVPIPSVDQGRRIQTPYQWHHGLKDFAVPFLLDQRLNKVLAGSHEGYLYPRLGHAEIAEDPEVLKRIRAWYDRNGLF